MGINVNVASTHGFHEIKRNLLFALNVKALIGIGKGGRGDEKRLCKGFERQLPFK